MVKKRSTFPLVIFQHFGWMTEGWTWKLDSEKSGNKMDNIPSLGKIFFAILLEYWMSLYPKRVDPSYWFNGLWLFHSSKVISGRQFKGFCHHSAGFRPHLRRNSCPCSWIHLLDTHFVPTITGHAACLVDWSGSPDFNRLNQNAAVPFCGLMIVSASRNTVEPPASTSVICTTYKPQELINLQENRMLWMIRFC